jgi:hypothetical protein
LSHCPRLRGFDALLVVFAARRRADGMASGGEAQKGNRPSWPDIPDFTYAADFTFDRAGWLQADSYGQPLHCQPRTG